MAEYTDQEKDTIRRAAFGAMGLVSKADPGFFASFSESFAGAKALAAAPPEIAELLQGGRIAPTASTMQEFEAQTLQRLRESMQITAKDPAAQTALRDVILAACQHVADASKGTSATEQAVIDQVRQAVGEGNAQAPSGGQFQPVPQPGQFQPNQVVGMGDVPAAGAATDAVGSGAERVEDGAQRSGTDSGSGDAPLFVGRPEDQAPQVTGADSDQAAWQAQEDVAPQDAPGSTDDAVPQGAPAQPSGDEARLAADTEDFAADEGGPPAPGSGGGSW